MTNFFIVTPCVFITLRPTDKSEVHIVYMSAVVCIRIYQYLNLHKCYGHSYFILKVTTGKGRIRRCRLTTLFLLLGSQKAFFFYISETCYGHNKV